jgi:Spy/CpxP family protein refolding chaperone
MKTSFLCIALVAFGLVAPVAGTLMADDTAAAPATGSSTQEQRIQELKAALDQLNLTDAQKAQIKQIRATVSDKKERRQQIMAVLTPDQKAKLRELIMAKRNASGA